MMAMCAHIDAEEERRQGPLAGLEDEEEELARLVKEKLPQEYWEFVDVFSKAKSDQLPPRRPDFDHQIRN
ncbi:hypothetical protein E4U58_001716 [Claviceps cyperi]|nr:hypothetical protein E4U58_001716 [Claviceps cyperi]